MSYQGGPPPRNTYYSQANAYSYPEPRPQQLRPAGPSPSPYQSSNDHQQQEWQSSSGFQHGVPPSHSYNDAAPPPSSPLPPQDYQQPQFISPAQLFQQQPMIQHRPSPTYSPSELTSGGHKLPSPAFNPSRIAPVNSGDSQIDMPMLLVSLAEEYFDAAHKLAPSVALSRTEANIGAYEQLIATGLGCLDTALKRVRLPPRMEANIRLRYAGVLFEETENSMEAETTLSKGIALCERNHYFDLKYAMQFLLAQWMVKKNPKAAMKALDGHITDAQTYQHFSWVYAFRFLRASYSLESGILTDSHAAIQHLREIATLAKQQADHAIHLTASLMETMAHMKSTGPDSLENVQRALAAARSNQLHTTSKIPQLVGLTHILDVCYSIRQGSPQLMMCKLKDMQSIMDESLKDPTWATTKNVIAVPINRTLKSSQTVSQDTRTVLGIGFDGRDNLMMAFLSQKDAYAITYLLCGIIAFQKTAGDQNGINYLEAGLSLLEASTRNSAGSFGLLPDLIATHRWRGQVLCYLRLYMASAMAAISEWKTSKKYLDAARATFERLDVPLQGPVRCLMAYLTGAFYQGTGKLDAALQTFEDPIFDLSSMKGSCLTSASQVERDIALLAALNRLWILQESSRFDPVRNIAMLAKLEPLFSNHPNRDIRTAFDLIMATVKTEPPTLLYDTKSRLRAALAGAQTTGNTQFLCITLSVMCGRFFSGIKGEQAEKSAMAGSVQALKTKNRLWMSVADGMLARCYEVQGKKVEAQKAMESATSNSERAFSEF